MVLRSLLTAVVVCALFVTPAAAQDVPRLVAFSGIADGNSPPSKPVAITIAIYDDATASTPLFLETHTVQLGQQRRFDVVLGSATGGGLPASLFTSNAAQWIGVQVAGQPEQARIMVISVPYALKSADSDKLGGLPASEYLTEFDPSSANAYTDAQVAAEAAARAAADTTLQSNIDAESAARAAADTTLQFNIDAEAAARAAGDVTLQGNIDAEAASRAAADTTLQFNIDAEAAARAAGDTTLQGNIDAEAAARAAADTTLQSNIDAEAAARAQGDINALSAANTYTDSNVAAEAAARGAADTTLQSNIDAEAAARAQGDIDTLGAANAFTNAQVAAEAAARSAADALFQFRVDGACGGNSAMVSVNPDGSVNCVSTDVNPGDDITSLLAGAGISVTGSGGSRTITNTGDTNTADDITSLSGGAGIAVTGSGNSRTVSNTGDLNALDDITSVSGGTGISITGSGSSRTVTVDTHLLNGATFGNGGSGAFVFNSAGSVFSTCSPFTYITGRVLTFPTDIAGGCGDAAYIANFAQAGESTVLELGVQNDSEDHIALMASGNVGIGTRSPDDTLQVFGDIRVGTTLGSGCVKRFDGTAILGTCSSDERLKTNIRPFPALLDKLTKLQPTYFSWRPEQAPALHLSGESFGLIAQDVEKVLPELVANDGREGYKAVHYEMLPMMMLQAMRELKAENDTLKSALAEQAARLQAIEAAIKK